MFSRLLPLVALLATSHAAILPALLPLTPSGMGLRGPTGLGMLTAQSPRPYYLYETSAAQLREFLKTNPAFADWDDNEERKEGEAEPRVYLGAEGDADSIAIVDLRPDFDYDPGHIIGAHQWPMRDDLGEHEDYAEALNKGTWKDAPDFFKTDRARDVLRAKYVVFYCNAGSQRSPTIARAYYMWRQAILKGWPAGQPLPFRRVQEVVLLGNGIKNLVLDPDNWMLVTPRPHKVVKPKMVDNASKQANILKENPHKFDKIAGTGGDIDPDILSQQTSRSDRSFPHSLTDFNEGGFDTPRPNKPKTPAVGSLNLDAGRRHTVADNAGRRGTLEDDRENSGRRGTLEDVQARWGALEDDQDSEGDGEPLNTERKGKIARRWVA